MDDIDKWLGLDFWQQNSSKNWRERMFTKYAASIFWCTLKDIQAAKYTLIKFAKTQMRHYVKSLILDVKFVINLDYCVLMNCFEYLIKNTVQVSVCA